MKLRILSIITFTLISLLVGAQSKIIVPKYIKMPKDSVVREQLISDLNSFLTLTQEKNEINRYVLPKEKVETFILLDEFKGVEKSRKFKDEHFF